MDPEIYRGPTVVGTATCTQHVSLYDMARLIEIQASVCRLSIRDDVYLLAREETRQTSHIKLSQENSKFELRAIASKSLRSQPMKNGLPRNSS